jgi:hypothetical protein
MGQVIRGGEQFETAIQADHRGQLLKQGADSGAVDAFGRQRVSQPFTLFDSVLRHSQECRDYGTKPLVVARLNTCQMKARC